MNVPPLRRALTLTAAVAALFCAFIAGMMTFDHYTANANDPWKSPKLLALKEKLAAEPKNAALQEQIRELDLKFRRRFHNRLAMDKTGAWFLLGGGLVCVLAAGRALSLAKAIPLPAPRTNAAGAGSRMASRARWSVAGVALALAASCALVAWTHPSNLPSTPDAWQKYLARLNRESPPEQSGPSLAEFQTNWPRFRGWDGSGVTTETNPGANLVWRVPISAPGHSSPIVWDRRVFISGGTAARREVFCYDAANGALLWDKSAENVGRSPSKAQEVPEDTTYAAPTMAADGRRVFAIFANGDLAAFNFDGSPAWSAFLGPMKNDYGYAASLAVWSNNLIVQLDQGGSDPSGSKIICFQTASGRELWERPRPVPASWATPIIVDIEGAVQIITAANPWVIGYALNGGKELWRAQALEGEIVPSPIFAGGLVIVPSPGSKMLALRADGTGDVTTSAIVWSSADSQPDITSPVAKDGLIFTVSSTGAAICLNAADGKRVWEKNLNMDVQASPIIAGGEMLILGKDGTLVSLAAASQPRELARSQWPDKFLASPALTGGRVFLRGTTNLFCLGPAASRFGEKP